MIPSIDWQLFSLQVVTTFAHFLWQGALIGAVLVLLLRFCSSRSANTRYLIACVAFALLPLCVVATFAVVHHADDPALVALGSATREASLLVQSPAIAEFAAPDIAVAATQVSAPQSPQIPIAEAIALTINAESSSLSWLPSASPYLLIVYLVGVALFLMRLGSSIWTSGRLRRTIKKIEDATITRTIAAQATRLGLKRVPKFGVCERVSVPVVVGILKPTILLPPAILVGLDPQQLAAILSHEMAHIRRFDLFVNLMQRIVEALLFFHPVTWWISRRMSAEREDCCDDLAVAGCGRLEFASALLHMAELCAKKRGLTIGSQLEAMAADGGKQSQLTRRVRRLLGEENSPRFVLSVVPFVMASIAALILAVSAVAVAQTDANSPTVTDDQSIATTETPNKAEDVKEAPVLSHYEGTVLGPDGKPMQGAEVFVISNWNETTLLGPVRDVSDVDGKFSFDAEDMTWQTLGKTMRRGGLIVAKKQGFVPEWMETWGHSRGIFSTGLWGTTSKQTLELQLTRDDVPIRGQLLDADGNPLVGARMRLTGIMVPRNRDLTEFLDYWSKANVSATFMTGINYKRQIRKHFEVMDLESEWVSDAEGRFELSGIGRDRMVQLEVSAPDIITTRIQVMARVTEDVGILLDGFDGKGKPTQTIYGANFSAKLAAGLTVKGVVRDRDTKEPVAGMWVTRRGYNALTAPEQTKDAVVTDADGRFTLRGLNPKLLEYEKQSTRSITAVPQPGVQYLKAGTFFAKDKETVIETVRGIRYRLKVVDEDGQPVNAKVEYRRIHPNSIGLDMVRSVGGGADGHLNHAALRDDGTYEGFVLPGPGAVLVSVPGNKYRPAHVEPKSFFAPGKTWDEDSTYTYGTHNILATGGGWHDQRRHEAIVLVNPTKDSQPLTLKATLVKDQPRTVSLVDSVGKPVFGSVARMHERRGTSHVNQTISGSSFPLEGLNVDKDQWITFLHEERKLAAVVAIRGDSDGDVTVKLQPWGAVKGRFVDENGKPVAITGKSKFSTIVNNKAHGAKEYFAHAVNEDGTFQIEGFGAGQSYDTSGTYRKRKNYIPGGLFKNLVLEPGEVRDLGDVSVQIP